MSQELQVVLCYSCHAYQTHIVKKSNKWICKICNEKQSLKKVYAQGNGTDCRKHCQMLNELRAKRDIDDKNLTIQKVDTENNCIGVSSQREEQTMSTTGSKWAKYLSQPSNSDSEDGDFEEEIRPSQLFLPKCTPESIDISFNKKFKNEYGQSLGMDHKMVLKGANDHSFNVETVTNREEKLSKPVESKRKLDQELDCRTENTDRKVCDSSMINVNFDLFEDSLIEDTCFVDIDNSEISALKDTSVREDVNINNSNYSEPSNQTIQNFSNKKIFSSKPNKPTLFKMVPSDTLLVEHLQRKVSLFEDINSYSVDQLHEMCKF